MLGKLQKIKKNESLNQCKIASSRILLLNTTTVQPNHHEIISNKFSWNILLATLGFVATEFVHLPGDVHAVNSILAHNAAVSSGSAFQVLTAIAGLEFIACIAMKEMFDGSGRAPGDFSFDPLNLSAKLDQKKKDEMALKELENGRLAMVAFSGIVTQAVLTQHGFPYI